MYIARMQLTAQFGHLDACLEILRKWERDVGQRSGWRLSSTRLVVGQLGASQGSIEFEVRVDSLTDLESAWADLDKNPNHKAYMGELTPLVTTPLTWSVHRVVELFGAND